MKEHLKLAIFVVWLIISGIILFVLIVPFLFSPDSINAIAPKCEWKTKYNKECLLCGMTTSFIYISQGKFTQAYITNKLSLYLYSFFVINEIALIFVLIKKRKRGLLALEKTLSSV